MWLASKKKLLNITLLASLVIVLPGWQAGEGVAAPFAINVPETYKSAFTLAGRASVSVTFEPAAPMILEFDLTATPDVGWTFSLTDSNGVSLIDADMDGDFETNGQVVSPYTVVVHASSPVSLPGVGYTKVDFRAYSKINPGDSSPVVKLQFAVPPSFVYAMSDSAYLMRLAYLSPNARMEASELLTTGGINLAISAAVVSNKRYILAWENLLNTPPNSQNVEFSIFNHVGGKLNTEIIKPFDHVFSPNKIIDKEPVLAASTGDKFGLIFLRDSYTSNTLTKREALFQLFTSDGIKVHANAILLREYTNAFEVYSPRVVANLDAVNPKMIAAWTDFNIGNGEVSIWAARLNAATGALDSVGGSLPANPKQLVILNNVDLQPVLVPLRGTDHRTFIAYSTDADSIRLNDMDANLVLDISQTPVDLNGVIASSRDAVQFPDNGNILFAWTDTSQAPPKVMLTLVNEFVNQQYATFPKALDTPKNLTPANLSVAMNNQNQAMVFWWSAYGFGDPGYPGEFLNFALIDNVGNVIIPPMIFRESGPANNLNINPNGQGIVGLDGLFAQFMPSINK